eukprot:m.210402 g.210402  ORF g.210402 m.210402 type:complete len:355 (-) comp33075_c1_seq2:89-1153(-)
MHTLRKCRNVRACLMTATFGQTCKTPVSSTGAAPITHRFLCQGATPRRFHEFAPQPPARFPFSRWSQNQGMGCSASRTMASSTSPLTQPKVEFDEGVTSVKVIDIEQVSECVKLFSLQVPTRFAFQAGQWLDVFMPGLETIGGFSFANGPHHTSNPKHPSKTMVQLAVKFSDHPPAKWMHQKIEVGSRLGIRVGGDTVLIEEPEAPAIFIAGGIGVAPLHSMLQERLAWLGDAPPVTTPTLLLYSVRVTEDLLFIDSISDLARVNPNFNVRIFLSGHAASDILDTVVHHGFPLIPGRISESSLAEAVTGCGIDQLPVEPRAYLCGPPNMVEGVKASLLSIEAIPEDRIHYERWW